MDSLFRPIRKETVMCTVQGCEDVAAFVFTGLVNGAEEGRPVVAAYCDRHAEQTAAQLGHPLPPAGRMPEGRLTRARVFRAS